MSDDRYRKPEPKPVAVQTYFGGVWHIKRTPWSTSTACTVSIPYYQTARRAPATIDPAMRCTADPCRWVFDECDRLDEASVPGA